ncbi:hypothetical protein SDC9_189441 [bioreactor metagenome]|uniref:Uncharacterized protein n=1 Tax=bioreactor metagenome TaxID=1076179 RepID=A0A645HTJ0_9ZZZZ
MQREKAGQRRRQMFAERGGVAQQLHRARQTVAVVAQLGLQLLHLLDHHSGMPKHGVPGAGRAHTPPLAHQQRRVDVGLHAQNALTGRRQ